jgi:hypothetical protein
MEPKALRAPRFAREAVPPYRPPPEPFTPQAFKRRSVAIRSVNDMIHSLEGTWTVRQVRRLRRDTPKGDPLPAPVRDD